MMALLKIARIKGDRATDDSFVDLAGYAACGGECWDSDANDDENDYEMIYDGRGGYTCVKHTCNGQDRNDELLTTSDPLKKKILEKAQSTESKNRDGCETETESESDDEENATAYKFMSGIDKGIIDWCKSRRPIL